MLAVDAGNSSVKFAVVARPGGKPGLLARVPNTEMSVARVRATAKKSGAVASAAACVVPRTAATLLAACPRMIMIGPSSPLNFTTAVDRRTVGADRLANMAEAARRGRANTIVADFGTAATFDLLDAHGRFVGGAIGPGLRTLALSLAAKAAQLPAAALQPPRRWAGRNTAEALRAGVAGGYAGLVLHVLAKLAGSGHGRRAPALVFTGGDAAVVARLTGCKAVIDPVWTLRGVCALAELALRKTGEQRPCRHGAEG